MMSTRRCRTRSSPTPRPVTSVADPVAFGNCGGAWPGGGKRGGVRVIYYVSLQQGQVWMLTLYAKNETDSISGAILKKIKEELDGKD